MIEQYEAAVLEWFNTAYPQIVTMTYAKKEDILESMKRIIEYPSLIYSRDEEEWVLSKSAKVYSEEEGSPVKNVFYQTSQTYTATLFLRKESDLYKISNILRQRWGSDSYVTLCYPNESSTLRVAMRLLSFKMVTERSSVEDKGPKRYIVMRWTSSLFLEAEYLVHRYTGFRLSIVSMPDGSKTVVKSSCSGN